MYTWDIFRHFFFFFFFIKATFWDSLFAFLHTYSNLERESTLKGNNLLCSEMKDFATRVAKCSPFSVEQRKSKMCLPCKNGLVYPHSSIFTREQSNYDRAASH